MKKITNYEKGILTACAVLQEIHGQTRIAGDIIKEMELTHANCATLNSRTRMYLKIIQEQERLNLTGLD
ncbi:hypothetical protein ZW22_004528 [Salmonella enterica subsp. enterica serovar Oranienburg]|nr:hypothetical protein [Salmonella enterica subsp. enterica serovar Oranienburg]